MSFFPNAQVLVVPHRTSSTKRLSQELKAKSQKLEAFHKILPRHLPDLAGQLQLEEGGEDF